MNDKHLRFIDLFAGIGGFRLGFEKVGCECVFSAEIDEHACEMYELNFGNNPKCDITQLEPKDIPDFDILCAGFPCQAFSICGKQKGFYDKTRGTLFFDICRILDEKKPKAFMLSITISFSFISLPLQPINSTFSIGSASVRCASYISSSWQFMNAEAIFPSPFLHIW